MFEKRFLGQVPLHMGLVRGGGGLPPGTYAEGWDSFLLQPVLFPRIVPVRGRRRVLPTIARRPRAF